MKRILRFLARTDLPIHTYVWKVALIALVPSYLISMGVTLTRRGEGGAVFEGPLVIVVLSVLFLSPWLETLLMAPILWILKKFTRTQLSVAICSAAVWAIVHSLLAPVWGLIIAWPFFVFSVCFLEWEKKSKGKAVVVTALVHTGQNVIPAIAISLSR